ncbi:MAG: DUF3376 domain-containing protein [Deltaproteobacteria bacterium]|nr:DUF3376 domain-containing protein [Deltaproteobacteria bacterium]
MPINIGMTFYGGVSLAVYEAGVAEEFLHFIYFCRSDQHLIRPKPEVNVEIISGTSAGGLAAVLMAGALANSSNPLEHIREMRRIWFDVADIGRLHYQGEEPKSLLNNDILEREVDEYLKRKGGGLPLCKDVRIALTGTNMNGFFDAIVVEDDFSDPGQVAHRTIPTTRHTEVFSFTGDEISKSVGERTVRERLGKAARITSSFPGAFPPVLVQSPSFPEEIVKNLFWYFDGGVLDNKPLGHAIDFLESSPETGERFFFFIEPKPEAYEKDQKGWGEDPKNPPDPLGTALTVSSVRGVETIYYDLRRIQQINHRVQMLKGFVNGLWSTLLQETWIDGLEGAVQTARLHRFVPDYMKCVTSIRSRFFPLLTQPQRDSLEQQMRRLLEMEPLDLDRILLDFLEKVRTSGLPLSFPENLRQTILATYNELEGQLRELDALGSVVKEKQKAFRQITFWVEDDYIHGQQMTDETWHEFVRSYEGERGIGPAVGTYEDRYREFMGSLMARLRANGLANNTISDLESFVTRYTLLNELLHVVAGVEARDVIQIVRITRPTNGDSLAGTALMNFGGFLSKDWRKNDYELGRRDALAGLQEHIFKNWPQNEKDGFWAAYENYRRRVEDQIGEHLSLGQHVLLSRPQKDLSNLQAILFVPELRYLMRTTQKIVKKYQDQDRVALLYRLLRYPTVTFWFFRPLLWLTQQTVTPGKGIQDLTIPRVADVWRVLSNRVRYVLFGLLFGFILAYLAPEWLGHLVRWLAKKIGLAP